MKKLNNKGFTLVELLAVIIILAIVVGITIPAVLTTTKKTKEKAFKTAAQTVATWVDSQYQIYTSGLGNSGLATLDSNFTAFCGNTMTNCTRIRDEELVGTGNKRVISNASASNFVTAAGLKKENINVVAVKIDPSTGRSCVRITPARDGDYYDSGLSEVYGGVC